MKVDFLVKNKVSEENFEDTVYDWLSQGDYTPDDIIENIITEHNLTYLPIHYYNADYNGYATASLGYMRREYYHVYNPQTKRQEKKSRTVTDWLPHFQPTSGDVSSTQYVGEEKYQFLAPFIAGMGWRSSDLLPPDDEASRNHQMLSLFKESPEDTWNDKALQDCHNQAAQQTKASLPSTLVRNFDANIKFQLTQVMSLIVPYWVFMYEYNDELYYVAVDGNNPSRVRGIRPENKARKNKVRALRWLGYPASGVIAYFSSLSFNEAYSDHDGLKTIGIFLLCLIAIIFIVETIVSSIKSSSKFRRQEKLNERRNLKASKA